MKTRSQDKMGSDNKSEKGNKDNKGNKGEKGNKGNKSNKNNKGNKEDDKNFLIMDEEVDPSELDDRGNIKDLIDYSDENDYQVYNKAMEDREKIVNKVYKNIKNKPIEEINGDDDVDDEEGEEDDENKPNKPKEPKRFIILRLSLKNTDDEEGEDDGYEEDDDQEEEDYEGEEGEEEEEEDDEYEDKENEEDGSECLDELNTSDVLTEDDEEEGVKIYNTRNHSNKRKYEEGSEHDEGVEDEEGEGEEEDDEEICKINGVNKDNKSEKSEKGGNNNKRQKREDKPEVKSPGDFLSMLLGGGGNKKDALKQRVAKSGIPDQYKAMVLNRIEHMDNDKAKEAQWVDNILKIPFGKYAKVPVTLKSKKEEIEKFFDSAVETLDNAVYGMDTVKEEIMNYLAQFISTDNESFPRILALHGSPGIGKTAVIRNGVSKVLGRPMKCINIGGLRDSSHFLGFDYTYSGSRYGIIVSSIIETGIMNPIIFMDELDKISLSNDGLEIQNLLIHLTDPVQNHAFHDKYFAGIDIDMSKAIFVFSFNDINLIHPVLKDRLHIVKVPDPTVEQKIIIGKRYLLPEMCKNVGMKIEDINITDDIIRSIINSYCKDEKGVRDLKRNLETLLLRINLARYVGKCKYSKIDKIIFPFTIDTNIVELLLKKRNAQEDWPEHVKNMYM